MNAITPFAFESHAVRVITDAQGEPLFVAADVCDALGLTNTSEALSKLDDDEKGISLTDTPGGPRNPSVVNESLALSEHQTQEAILRYHGWTLAGYAACGAECSQERNL
ncbi:MAG: hypothetical protein KAX64_00640 [Chromatiaceae bacterium]|nr:hypothetical protein [Chromatiaceae bacterium]